ncbi:MAG: DUF2505 family protein [Myxococcota bacterium]
MTTHSNHTFVLEGVSPDRALEVLSSAAFEVAQQVERSGTQSARVEPMPAEEGFRTYALHAVEYGRGFRGIDTSTTVETVTTVHWDCRKRRGTWSYQGSQARLAKVWGSTQIEPHDSGCRVTFRYHMEIALPLVGRRIEAFLIGVLDRHMRDHVERLAHQMCGAKPPNLSHEG